MSARAGIALELVFGGVFERLGERLPEEADLNEFWPGKGGGASELDLVMSARAGIALEFVFGGVVKTMGENLPEEACFNEFWPGRWGGGFRAGFSDVSAGWDCFRIGFWRDGQNNGGKPS